MTRTTTARTAGVTFLVYIAVSIVGMVLFGRATAGDGIAAKLTSIAQHATDMGGVVVLALLGCVAALVLAVTLYSLTRAQDPDIAMLALTCRVAEGVISAISIPGTLGLLWLATATTANAPDAAAVHVLGAYLLRADMALSGSFFAIGSTLFCYLLLRGRMIPTVLAWLGVISSLLLVVALPLQLAGFLGGPITSLIWLPMIVFEVAFALWLLVRGVAPPTRTQPV
jgi:hypothetical protein